MTATDVIVHGDASGFAQEIVVGPHRLTADEPSEFGGKIEREIHLVGTLDPEQRKRLLEIADKCPVHRTLKSEIDIQTRAV
jgi:uncharacterized OsmC-like protein